MSDERPVTIMMPLKNAGSSVYRPVQALRQREDIYIVIGPMPEDEQWRFPPGTMIRRKSKIMSDGRQEMVATAI